MLAASFGSFYLGHMTGVGHFGILACFGIMVAFLGDITLSPALVALVRARLQGPSGVSRRV